MNPQDARKKLLAQHDGLRGHLARCKTLARTYRTDGSSGIELELAVARLRSDFVAHNATEAALIKPLLQSSPTWGALLVDRMLEEHVAEHTAFWEKLSGTFAGLATRIDDLADELEAHMAAEERTFLSSAVLRADVIEKHRSN
ncbi:MAG TPA: hypothetical protein VGM39_08280 [Kofleriaceae bacterium]|jgi:hypothetical protein